MKRLLLLWGLLLAFIAPTLAQTKTDTIRFNIKPITDDASDWILKFSFPDSIKNGIEIEWIAYNERNSHYYKPGENGFNPNQEGIYSCSIPDSGQICIYYTYKQSCSYGFALGGFVSNDTIPVISVAYGYDLRIDSLEISSTDLTMLYCLYTQLTCLDASKITALTYLDCYGNQLTSLDISQNNALTYLNCSFNQLTSLDINHNTVLTYLNCDYNQLITLNVSNNTSLETLWCTNNQLTTLNVSANTSLTELYCGYFTYYNEYYNGGNQLTNLDISNNTALKILDCSFNQLTTLNLSHNTALTYLSCHGNHLTILDLSQNSALTELYCSDNQLTKLDIRDCANLSVLWCSQNQLETLDIRLNTTLDGLNCASNQLTTLDVSNNTDLYYLECFNNHIPLNMLHKAYSQENNWHTFKADPQTDTIIIYSQQLLDLSAERILGENVSIFEISDTSGEALSSDAWTEKDFTFRFHKNGLYKLTLQNRFVGESEDAVTFTWYVSVVDEIPEGYFTVLVASDNAESGTVTGNGTYQENKNATITASPNKGYRFINWTKKDGTVFSTDSVHTFAVTENLELTANFEKLPDDVATEPHQTDHLRVYAQDRTIYLSENRGTVQVYNVTGQCVYSGTSTAIPVQQSGVYIVRVGTRSHKVLVR